MWRIVMRYFCPQRLAWRASEPNNAFWPIRWCRETHIWWSVCADAKTRDFFYWLMFWACQCLLSFFSLPPHPHHHVRWVLSNLSSGCSLLSEHLCMYHQAPYCHTLSTPWIPPRGPTTTSTKMLLKYSFFFLVKLRKGGKKILDFSCKHAVLSRTTFFQ
jgi:hypothetical protein